MLKFTCLATYVQSQIIKCGLNEPPGENVWGQCRVPSVTRCRSDSITVTPSQPEYSNLPTSFNFNLATFRWYHTFCEKKSYYSVRHSEESAEVISLCGLTGSFKLECHCGGFRWSDGHAKLSENFLRRQQPRVCGTYTRPQRIHRLLGRHTEVCISGAS